MSCWKSSAKSYHISGFWSASTWEMRMCLGRGTSPRSMSTQEQDAQGAGCSKETSEFVNHGKLIVGIYGYGWIVVIIQRNYVAIVLIWLWLLKWLVVWWLFSTVSVLDIVAFVDFLPWMLYPLISFSHCLLHFPCCLHIKYSSRINWRKMDPSLYFFHCFKCMYFVQIRPFQFPYILLLFFLFISVLLLLW